MPKIKYPKDEFHYLLNMGTGTPNCLKVLLWKRSLERIRGFIVTFIELALPISLILLVCLNIHTKDFAEDVESVHYSDPVSELQLFENSNIHYLFFAPNGSKHIREIMDEVRSTPRFQNQDLRVVGFMNEEDLLHSCTKRLKKSNDNFAIIFQDVPEDAFPEKLSYVIRSSSGAIHTTKTKPSFPAPGPHEHYGMVYEQTVALQLAVDKAFIKLRSGTPVTKRITVEGFPYPPFIQNNFLHTLYSVVIPLLVLFTYFFAFVSGVVRLVAERTSGIKELMKMMGVEKNQLWLSHFIEFNIFQTIITVLLIFFMTWSKDESPMVPHTNVLIFSFCLLLYSNYMILLAFFVSTLMNSTLRASIFSCMVWLLSTCACFLTGTYFSGAFSRLLLSLVPNVSVTWMLEIIGNYESQNEGVQWSNLFIPPVEAEFQMSLGFAITAMLLDCLVLAFLTWYIDQVFPGPYGVPKSIYFPCKMFCKQVTPGETLKTLETDNPEYFEMLPAKSAVGIKIRNVWKVFGSLGGTKKTALSGVSLDIPKSGVTVLLGHNGAGKTTLLSIITGMFAPTSGSIEFEGQSVHKGKAGVQRSSIGLCPQHNLCFGKLTIKQHFIFFAMLKGKTWREAQEDSARILLDLGLGGKAHELGCRLSGGMRRRVQLGIALAGSPSVLVLDEPTSGLDPESRRKLWDILLNIRSKHTILLTTHLMEEADVLGDRVAVVDHGRMQCYGTPMFLKKAYGTGSKLSIQKSSAVSSAPISQLILSQVPAELEVDTPLVCEFRLQGDNSQYATLFKSLEGKKDQLHIESIGLSVTTLEDVFLRVTSQASGDSDNNMLADVRLQLEDVETTDIDHPTAMQLLLSRSWALFVKKCLYYKSIFPSFLIQVILAFLLIVVYLQGDSDKEELRPSLDINLNMYGRPSYTVPSSGEKPRHMEDMAKIYNFKVENTSNAMEAVLAAGEAKVKRYSDDLLVAVSFEPDNIIGLYSTSVFHTLPVVVNLITNLLAAEGRTEPLTEPIITMAYYPIEKNMEAKLYRNQGISYSQLISLAIFLTLGCTVVVGVFIPFPIHERKTFSRELQQLTGTSPALYWAVALMCDAALCILWGLVAVTLLALFDTNQAVTFSTTAGPLYLLVSVHAIAAISFIYFLSIIINKMASGYIILNVITLFIGILLSSILVALDATEMDCSSCGVFDGLSTWLVPSYNLNKGVLKLGFAASSNMQCRQKYQNRTVPSSDYCCSRDEITGACSGLINHFTDDSWGILMNIVPLIVMAFCYMVLVLLYDHNVIDKVLEKVTLGRKPLSPTFVYHDDCVDEEKKLVNTETLNRRNKQSPSDTVLLVSKLSKAYKKFFRYIEPPAVKEINISIKKGECFGLLGVNGAGKSTTFKMLVGNEQCTQGEFFINSELKSMSMVGYCPQFDALDEYLTGRQVLTLFSRLQGVPEPRVHEYVADMLKLGGLSELSDVACGVYSGGSRRKLSTLVALGAGGGAGPGLVLLDEPTAGVDPQSRRSLHKLLRRAKDRSHSLLLSSHSMDECSLLCSRIGILSQGELACLGSVQQLKHKYAQGYQLTLKLAPAACNANRAPTAEDNSSSTPLAEEEDCVDSVEALHNFSLRRQGDAQLVSTLNTSIVNTFDCEKKDEHMTVVQYHIPDKNIPYSDLFSKMEVIKGSHGSVLEDYSISETTLEQIFLHFAKDAQQARERSCTENV